MRRLACLAVAVAVTVGLADAAAARSLVYCAEGRPAGFDPARHTDPATLDASAQAVYNRLVQFEPGTARVAPALAESWEISEDGLEYTFRLRPGVAFHGTAAFTPTRDLAADDVIFSFERQWRQDHPWYDYAGGAWPWFEGMSLPLVLRDIRKVDDLTVTFVLRRPYAPFLADLAMDFASILSKEYADRLLAAGERERLDSDPVGTGPFRLVGHAPGGVLRYEANAGYWRGRPALEGLVFDVTPDSGVRFERLKSGDCQLIPSPNPADVAAIRATAGLQVLEGPGFALAYLAFDTTEPPFDRIRARRAVAAAIDRQAIVLDAFDGMAALASGPLSPLMLGGSVTGEPPPFDAEAAREGVAAAEADGAGLRLWALPSVRPYMPEPERMIDMIRGDLAAAGIAVEVATPAAEAFLAETLAPDRGGVVLFGWVSDNGDPDNVLAPLLGCDAIGISNRAMWCNARFDALLAEARAATDAALRARLYAEAQAIVLDEMPIVPIAYAGIAAAATDDVRGFVVDPFGRHNFESVEIAGDE